MNLKVLRRLNVQYWEFFSKGPEIADVATYTAAVEVFDRVGAMTPNVAIGLANELLGTELKEIVEPWGDVPFSLTAKLAEQGKTVVGLEEVVEKPPPPPPGQAPPFVSPGEVGAKPPGQAPPFQTRPPWSGNGKERAGDEATIKSGLEALDQCITDLRSAASALLRPELSQKFIEAADGMEKLKSVLEQAVEEGAAVAVKASEAE